MLSISFTKQPGPPFMSWVSSVRVFAWLLPLFLTSPVRCQVVSSHSPSSSSLEIVGDLDGDGTIGMPDVRLLLLSVAGLRPLAPSDLQKADVMPRPGAEGRLAGDG